MTWLYEIVSARHGKVTRSQIWKGSNLNIGRSNGKPSDMTTEVIFSSIIINMHFVIKVSNKVHSLN